MFTDVKTLLTSLNNNFRAPSTLMFCLKPKGLKLKNQSCYIQKSINRLLIAFSNILDNTESKIIDLQLPGPCAQHF